MARRASSARGSVSSANRLSRTSSSPLASSISRTNWRCVAATAASGMLLTRPIAIVRQPRSANAPRRARRSPGAWSRRGSRRRAFDRQRHRAAYSAGAPRAGGGERLIEIFEDVVDMLEADADADRLRPHARLELLLGGHLPMGGRGGMAGERPRVADVDQPLDQPQRVVEALRRLEPALDAEGQQRGGASAEIFLRQREIGAVGQAGVIDPGDARVGAAAIRRPRGRCRRGARCAARTVSMPCSSRKALIGASTAPVVR